MFSQLGKFTPGASKDFLLIVLTLRFPYLFEWIKINSEKRIVLLFIRFSPILGRLPMKKREKILILLFIGFLIGVTAASGEVNPETWIPETDLSCAVVSGDLIRFTERIEAGADINEIDSQGRTALMWASLCHAEPFVKLLLEADAELNLFDEYDESALHLACANHVSNVGQNVHYLEPNAHLVKLLLDAGMDVNTRADPNAWTPLHSAMRDTYTISYPIVELLIKSGADVNATAHEWAPVNFLAKIAYSLRDDESRTEFLSLFDLLISAGADLNHIHGTWGPPIAQAATIQSIWFLDYLIGVGAEVNVSFASRSSENLKRKTALDLALESNNQEAEIVLRAAGALTATELGW